MTPARRHIAKRRRSLASGHRLLTGDFTEQAGRDAYLAAFHAAQAFIIGRTGKGPKTHAGTRREFARLVKEEPRIDQRFVSFLARSYEMKTYADYDGEQPVAHEEAAAALTVATEMVDLIEGLLPSD